MNKVAENADHGSFSPDTGLAAHALIDTAAFICFHIDRITDLYLSLDRLNPFRDTFP